MSTRRYETTHPVDWLHGPRLGALRARARREGPARRAGGPLTTGEGHGDPSVLNPEQLVVMAASSCQLLWFLHLASKARIDVVGVRRRGARPDARGPPAGADHRGHAATAHHDRGRGQRGARAQACAHRPRALLHSQQPEERDDDRAHDRGASLPPGDPGPVARAPDDPRRARAREQPGRWPPEAAAEQFAAPSASTAWARLSRASMAAASIRCSRWSDTSTRLRCS